MALEDYNKKRDFLKTSEPKGVVGKTRKKNLYIIQKHAASHLHYDFRLELNGVLLSWAIPKGPCFDPDVKRLAMQTEDHPISYGSFEGLIPKAEYGGGTVMLWDQGEWICTDPDPLKAYQKGHLHFELKAKKLKGNWSLFKWGKKEEKTWFLVKGRDNFCKKLTVFDITIKKPNSVVSGHSLEEITEHHQDLKSENKKINGKLNSKSPFPTSVKPQLATLVTSIPEGTNWAHEIKLDGYRILAFIKNKTIKLLSRTNKDWTKSFPNVVKELKKCNLKNAVLDGEIVLLNEESKSDFQLLQNAIEQGKDHPFIYYVFDMLYFDKYKLTELPLLQRKTILINYLPNKNKTIRYSEHIIGSGKDIFEKCIELGLEGIISKNIESSYIEKRSKTWLKIKCVKRQEFIIGGYTKPQGNRSYFGSLILGYYNDKNELICCGNVGTGFSDASLKTLHSQLQKYRIDFKPFKNSPAGHTTAFWVTPKFICEVEFIGWTKDGNLRHPSFKGIRLDKTIKNVVKETPQLISETMRSKKKLTTKQSLVNITHPDKILYPEDKITKLDLVDYYDTVSDWILPHIINRPLTIFRCMDTYKKGFYQKHINHTTPDNLHAIAIDSDNLSDDYFFIKNKKELLTLIQTGSLEIHPWGSTVNKLDYPNLITFDLDPSPEIKWKFIVEAALLIKHHLEEFKLKSFVKTTGGKGLHIVVPILQEYDWEAVKNFSKVFVTFLVSTYPKIFIENMSKEKRKGKIFVDHFRNRKGATSVSVYSTRARIHAPVSTPIAWDELTTNYEDTYFTIHTLPARLKNLKKDPWKGFFKLSQSLRLNKL